jgi:glucose-6-phosphate isomerase
LKCSDSTGATERFSPPHELPAWQALDAHADRLRAIHLSSLFASDSGRFERFSMRHDRLVADFSRHALDDAALDSLFELADQSGLRSAIEDLFSGARLNFTEDRAALHMAMRGSCPIPDADADNVRTTAQRMRAFARGLRNQKLTGATGRPFQRVISLGIGGSDLGPRMAVEALSRFSERRPAVSFVANIDPLELDEALIDANPHTTLFIISSKSFTTAETLANAHAARNWLTAALGEGADASAHFAAVSNAPAAAAAFGIAPERIFTLPEWIGGRYSVWSAIGLSLMIAIGESAFDRFQEGARSMDVHFRTAGFRENLPVTMALVGIWNTDFLGIESLAVLPYAHGLRNFPAWLQQLEMESNGKRCLRDGSTSNVATAPIVWGGVGTVGQHAFHQLFYQGMRRVALDFIVPAGSTDNGQRALLENALAQAAALMAGRDLAAARANLRHKNLSDPEIERLAPHLVCPGNQPSTTLLLPEIEPYTLGQLLALYEHKVFAQGWIWGINSFDQFGVELGKEMARSIAAPHGEAHDVSTDGLMAAAERLRKGL